ncbi:DEAD/DEAH box helicase family protein [Vibrio breoganii]
MDSNFLHNLTLENNQNPEVIKGCLSSLPVNQKGDAFEHFVALIYQSAGYYVEVNGGRGDAGADLLVYSSRTSETPIKIVQVKNFNKPLTYDQVRCELIKFEEQGSVRYSCNQFEIISMNGYVKSVKEVLNPLSLQRFNISLLSWSDLQAYVRDYKCGKPSKGTLDLFGYNRQTYNQVLALREAHNRICVTQATGTGKRFLVAQLMNDNPDARILFLSPSTYINAQQLRMIHSSHVDARTYQSMPRWASSIDEDYYDIIIVDEYHRLGSDVWGDAFRRLMLKHQSVFLFGVTATPVRHLDGARDMRALLFDVEATELSLSDAIVRGVLPEPTYITGVYDLDSVVEKYTDKINGLVKMSEVEKKRRCNEAGLLVSKWERESGVASLIASVAKDVSGKYVVFCEDIEHLESSVEMVRGWFRRVSRERHQHLVIDDYSMHTGFSTAVNRKQYAEFSKSSSCNQVKLLFSVGMLNEGVHISGVSSVILLRRTRSANLYLQQIGRCLSAGAKVRPLIFDFVSNIEQLGARVFEDSCRQSASDWMAERARYGLSETIPKLPDFVTGNIGLSALLESLSHLSDGAYGWLDLARRYVAEHGNKNLRRDTRYKGFSLGDWLQRVRGGESVPEDVLSELRGLGLRVVVKAQSPFREEALSAIESYCAENGTTLIAPGTMYNDFPLWEAVKTIRNYWLRGLRIPPKALERLDAINFAFDPKQRKWDEMYASLVRCEAEEPRLTTTSKTRYEGQAIGRWLNYQHDRYTSKSLGATLVARLEKLHAWRALVRARKLSTAK